MGFLGKVFVCMQWMVACGVAMMALGGIFMLLGLAVKKLANIVLTPTQKEDETYKDIVG